jgi:hypothetical protein
MFGSVGGLPQYQERQVNPENYGGVYAKAKSVGYGFTAD